jgi:hypothetical protein
MRQTFVVMVGLSVTLAMPDMGTAQMLSARRSVAVEDVTLDPLPLAFADSISTPAPVSREAESQTASEGATAPPPRAFEYSDGYHTRARIHRIASVATLPLFVTQGILGASIYNEPTDGKRTAHQAVAIGIGGLFAVNTTTGVWNLLEARKDPNLQKRRLVHGLLMLGSDAGLVATFATAPPEEGGGSRATHRAVAITSIAAATTGYLLMLFGAH